ncbi:MAG: AAA family ATPase [Bacteroidales bacterium]|nr:AAA family ATPase [Bacteroidales bacterium]
MNTIQGVPIGIQDFEKLRNGNYVYVNKTQLVYIPLLYQNGYLTIKSCKEDEDTFVLGFPNEEVKYGFLKELLSTRFLLAFHIDGTIHPNRSQNQQQRLRHSLHHRPPQTCENRCRIFANRERGKTVVDRVKKEQ